MENVFENNRTAWNEALGYHQKARGDSLQSGFENPDFTTFDRDCDQMQLHKIEAFGLRDKTIGQLPCNNGRELLSLMRYLGARAAYGFDISDTAIDEAKQFAEISGLSAIFERINILEISDKYNEMFDFIYISEGSLQWFPDLSAYFAVVSRLLKTGGHILIYEIHPFAYFFETGYTLGEPDIEKIPSYFDREPHSYPHGLDYVGGTEYEASECFWYMHKMSDIINAVLKSGFDLLEFEEYNIEMANTEAAKATDKLPLSYIITGKKR